MTLNWVETQALDFMVGQALKKKILEVSFLWVLFSLRVESSVFLFTQ